MKSGTFVVGKVQEGLDLVQAGVRIARVPQVLQVPPGGLLLAGGQRVEKGVEFLAGRVAHGGILAIQAGDRHPGHRSSDSGQETPRREFKPPFESGNRSNGDWSPCSGRIRRGTPAQEGGQATGKRKGPGLTEEGGEESSPPGDGRTAGESVRSVSA